MVDRSFQLSTAGIMQAAPLQTHDFTFIVGGTEYPCCRFQACFLSKRVCQILLGTASVDELILDIEDDQHQFNDVISLMNGAEITITDANASFLEQCARQLENYELLSSTVSFKLENTDFNLSNVIERIRLKCEFCGNTEAEISYLASEFHDLDSSFVAQLTVDELDQVLNSPSLKLKSEDQLLEIILSLVTERGKEYSTLFRHIQFQFLEPANLDRFLDLIFPDFVDGTVWQLLCKYMRMFSQSDHKDELIANQRYYFWTCHWSQGPFAGIISHLSEMCGGNVHEHGVVDITASSSYYNQCHQVVNYGWEGWWFTEKEPNAYIMFDFKYRSVSLSGYTLKSNGSTGGFHLLQWVIEASDDASDDSWEIIDSRDTYDLNGRFIVKTYECNHKNSKFYRFVRLRQTGKNSGGQDNLMLSEIEFFGRLKES